MKVFLRRWLPIYAPLLLLAAASFQLPQPPPQSPQYLAAFEGARYWRGGDGGGLTISAARMEQKTADKIDLFDLRMSQIFGGGGGIVLSGARGAAVRRGGSGGRLEIADAHGSVKNAGQTFNIRAEEIYYDIDGGGLSGRRPEISGESLNLRGDKFAWSIGGGLKVEGNVESFYQR